MSLRLADFISREYLLPDKLHKLYQDFREKQPIEYIVFDNFLKAELYAQVEKEFTASQEVFLDQYTQGYINNKTIFRYGKTLESVFEFFNSKELSDYFKIFLGRIVERGHKLDLKTLGLESFGIKGEGSIFQLYTKGDYMSWHTDLPKDMMRDKKVEEGGYKLWHEHHVESFDEVGAFVYYAFNSQNDDWKQEYGGVLEFGEYKGDSIEVFHSVLPLKNRLILFKSSNQSYHRVTEVTGDYKRYTIQDLLKKPE